MNEYGLQTTTGMRTYPDPYYNMQQMMQQNRFLPRMEVVRVNGRQGAEAFQMGPNSSALLLDESGKIVWGCTTDGAGYKTVIPYDITLHEDAPAPDFTSLESRIKRLEDMLNGNSGHTAADGAAE